MDVKEYCQELYKLGYLDRTLMLRSGPNSLRIDGDIYQSWRRATVSYNGTYLNQGSWISSDEDWNMVNDVVEDKFQDLTSGYNYSVPYQMTTVQDTMAAVVKYGIVNIKIPGFVYSVFVSRAGRGTVRVTRTEDSFYKIPNATMNLRDFRRWLTVTADSALAELAQENKTGAIDWLTKNSDKGIFEVDITEQKLPFLIRPPLEINDWRYRSPRGDFRERTRVILAGSDQLESLDLLQDFWYSAYDLKKVCDRTAYSPETRTTREGNTILLDITQNFGWYRGMFGDDGSCWWREHNRARSALYHMGGWALRLWRSPNEGAGRVWVAPTQNGGIVIFNSYGHTAWDVHSGAAIIEHATGSHAHRCTIKGWPDAMYINNATMYSFGESETEVTLELPFPNMNCDNMTLAWKANSIDWADKLYYLRQENGYNFVPSYSDHQSLEPLCERGARLPSWGSNDDECDFDDDDND